MSGNYRQQPARKADGSVGGWGANWSGQCTIPPTLGSVVAVATGYDHSLALKPNGTVAAWGANTYGQTSIPSGLSGVVAVASGKNLAWP